MNSQESSPYCFIIFQMSITHVISLQIISCKWKRNVWEELHPCWTGVTERHGPRICRSDASSSAFVIERLLGARLCCGPMNESVYLSRLDSLTWQRHEFSTESRVPGKTGVQRKGLASDPTNATWNLTQRGSRYSAQGVPWPFWNGLDWILPCQLWVT